MSTLVQWGPYTTPMVSTAVLDGLRCHRQKFTQKNFSPDSENTVHDFNQLFNEYGKILRKSVGKSFTLSEVKIREPKQFEALFSTLNCYLLGYNLVLKRQGKFYSVVSKGSS